MLKLLLTLVLSIAPFVCCCAGEAMAMETVVAAVISSPCPAGEKCCDEGEAGCFNLQPVAVELTNKSVSWERVSFVNSSSFEYVGPTLLRSVSLNSLLSALPPPSGVPLFIQYRSIRL